MREYYPCGMATSELDSDCVHILMLLQTCLICLAWNCRYFFCGPTSHCPNMILSMLVYFSPYTSAHLPSCICGMQKESPLGVNTQSAHPGKLKIFRKGNYPFIVHPNFQFTWVFELLLVSLAWDNGCWTSSLASWSSPHIKFWVVSNGDNTSKKQRKKVKMLNALLYLLIPEWTRREGANDYSGLIFMLNCITAISLCSMTHRLIFSEFLAFCHLIWCDYYSFHHQLNYCHQSFDCWDLLWHSSVFVIHFLCL